jgi:trigger factor
MQVTETNTHGLKRTLRIVLGQDEIGERFSRRLDEVKDRVQLKGFRKGRVPVAHLKKVFGRSLMAEVLEQAVKETSTQAIIERKERPALQPDISLPEDKDEIEKVISGKADFAYSMSFEVLPAIEIADLSGIKLERLVADVDQADIDKAIGELADRATTFEPEAGRAAEKGDRVTVDFVGKIDGTPFENGADEDMALVIGQGNFIPGFEDGLIGATTGEERVVSARFPDEYPAPDLAGKAATFDVKVKEVAKPIKPAIDDGLATTLGLESLAKLREVIGAQLQGELDAAARLKLKRELLDALDKAHTFELPGSLVEREFENIWGQLARNLERSGKTLADENKSEDEARAEYKRLAERRVRLGLVIGELGERNKIEVTQDELRRALVEHARRYPGQEKFVYEYFEKTPGAIQELRAPIFEDKVVDLVLAEAKPSESKVTKEELMKRVAEVTEQEA